MEHGAEYAYGLWLMAAINIIFFLAFAFTFVKPKTSFDWRSFGMFSAFIVALFTEMYGFPLTIFLLSGWLQSKYPGLDLFAHDSGHLLHTLLGLPGNPHFDPLHIASNILILAGLLLLSSSWRVLYRAQRAGTLAREGWYARVRHPQYVAFIIVMFGFLLQWPTVLTIPMFPILVWMYVKLARAEEKKAQKEFGKEYEEYMKKTPGFIPTVKSWKKGART
jgi:protein-S-isoprenylcysteine O-methyltransferase Ste14